MISMSQSVGLIHIGSVTASRPSRVLQASERLCLNPDEPAQVTGWLRLPAASEAKP